jgi:hypothetical protein
MSTNSKSDILVKLHQLLAEEFLEQISEGTTVSVNGPNGPTLERTSPPASVLNAARAFLHDNHIDVNSSKLSRGSTLINLAENLEHGDHVTGSGLELPEFEQ